jgi:HD-GYP domain-containing protein (c-di-GMP phosphodiesterase class II)
VSKTTATETSSTELALQELVFAYGPSFASSSLLPQLNVPPLTLIPIESLAQALQHQPALIILDYTLIATTSLTEWRAALPDSLLLSTAALELDTDIVLSDSLPPIQTRKLIKLACENWLARKAVHESRQVLDAMEGNLGKLASVGIALAAENDLGVLLKKILTEGQSISACDAASLFLVDTGGEHITFKLTQNDSITFPFIESRFKLDAHSIAGHVAQTRTPLNIQDAYNIPVDASYRFNARFDSSTGYRTVSMLTLPALNKKKEVIAVLQFINRKKQRQLMLTPGTDTTAHIIPFNEESVLLLQALAGQAGVAIENAILHNDIQKLFEGFVKASVMAIEQRDPSTSGHSFRVADLCVALANAINLSPDPLHKQHIHSDVQIRELRYAALLHDFGKVGVRESVLVKAKKLGTGSLNNIHMRVLLAKEKLRNSSLEQQLHLFRTGAADTAKIQAIELRLALELEQLDHFLETIIDANEPHILNAGDLQELSRVADYCKPFEQRHGFAIVSPEEFSLLSITKGSLSLEERREIESHVTHTRNFLRLIPWTTELRNIPEIAGAHHEKINGSGYPDGKQAAEIPFGSKIMTICDIYDALTASDRPYKAAVPPEHALDILQQEAKSGAIDRGLMKVFIESEAYKTIAVKDYSSNYEGAIHFQHHVCDFDLHSKHD